LDFIGAAESLSIIVIEEHNQKSNQIKSNQIKSKQSKSKQSKAKQS
jgi:hypothetical protein